MTFEQTDPVTGHVTKDVTGDQVIRYFAEHDDGTDLGMVLKVVRCFEAGQFPQATIEHDDGTIWRIER